MLTQLEFFFSTKQVFSQPCKFLLTEYWTLSQLPRSGIFVLHRVAPTGPDKPSPGPPLLAGTAESPQFPEFKNRKQSLYVLPITWYHISTSFLKSWKTYSLMTRAPKAAPQICKSLFTERGPFLPYPSVFFGSKHHCRILLSICGQALPLIRRSSTALWNNLQNSIYPTVCCNHDTRRFIPSRLKCVRSLWMYAK